MNKNSTQVLSNPLRFLLVLSALILLQLNVPLAQPFKLAFSADFTFRPVIEKSFWLPMKSLFAQLHQDIELTATGISQFCELPPVQMVQPKIFRIVKVESQKTDKKSNLFVWPVKGLISSAFGMRRHPVTYVRSFHNGIDIKARRGTRIVSPAEGVVLSAGRAGLMGRMVKIKTTKGLTLYFGHLQKISCKKGQKIRTGEAIGTVGASGRATGPHLHFSVQANGRYTNPMKYLSPR
ncbi:MAG: M23 family metallopeptidase [Candidatus Riflebacteria bacterium]